MVIAIGLILSKEKGVFYVAEEDRLRYNELGSRSDRLYKTGSLCFVGDCSDGKEIIDLARKNLGIAKHGDGYQLHQPSPRETDPESEEQSNHLHRAGVVEIVKDAYKSTRKRKFKDHILERYGLTWDDYRNPETRKSRPELFETIDNLLANRDFFNVRMLLMGSSAVSGELEMWNISFPGVANMVSSGYIGMASSNGGNNLEYNELVESVLGNEISKPHLRLLEDNGDAIVRNVLKRVLGDPPSTKTEALFLDIGAKSGEKWDFLF